MNTKYIWLLAFIALIFGITLINAKHGGLPSASTTPAPIVGPVNTEGSTVTIPSSATISGPVTAQFVDGGAHGWHAVQSGGGTYMDYDATVGLKYTAPATKDAGGNYTATVPDGMCGDIILPQGATPPSPKVIEVTLVGADGKPIAGVTPTKINLKCDTYTLNATIKANPDKVLPDGVSASTVTANFSVTGPAKFVNGVKIPKSNAPIILTTPLGLMMVHFNTSLGMLNPSPSNVKTDLSGSASVTVTSADAGIAKVIAQATGVGDAEVNVHFEPKITGVTENFVPPTSPTNYQISTIPSNPKDLTIDWTIVPPAGPTCGSLTGPASGMGLSKNGFFHGPTSDFPNGCDETYEFATQIKVTVTDKDGQSDTKIFNARALEGQGLVKLP